VARIEDLTWGACATTPVYRGLCATTPERPDPARGACVPQPPSTGACVPQPQKRRPRAARPALAASRHTVNVASITRRRAEQAGRSGDIAKTLFPVRCVIDPTGFPRTEVKKGTRGAVGAVPAFPG